MERKGLAVCLNPPRGTFDDSESLTRASVDGFDVRHHKTRPTGVKQMRSDLKELLLVVQRRLRARQRESDEYKACAWAAVVLLLISIV